MPRSLWGSQGGEYFLMSRVTLYQMIKHDRDEPVV